MRKILFSILCVVTISSLLLPSWVFARERQDRERDDTTENSEGTTSGGSTHVQTSVSISTSSGDNDNSDGTGGVKTGDQDAHVFVETVINGKVVQFLSEDGNEDGGISKDDRRTERSRLLEDRSHRIFVDTDIDIETDNNDDTGNQNKDGADGEDGKDGTDGDNADRVDETGNENDEEATNGGRDSRNRGERDLSHRISMLFGPESVWGSVSNFFAHVLSLLFA